MNRSIKPPALPITNEIVFGADTVSYFGEKPIVLYTIIIVNIIVYGITSFETSFIQSTVDWIVRLGLVPAQLLVEPASLYRIFTAMFTHADILHIFFNMYFLYIFGRAVERALGSLRFLALYLVSGILAVVFHTVFTYLQNPAMLTIPTIGASGAISGVLGAYMLLFPGTRLSACFLLLFIPVCFELSAVYYLLSWFAIQVIEGYILFNSGVAFFAHAGGFLAGVASLAFLADKARLRLLRLLSHTRSLFGILYFYTPFMQRGLSLQAKTLFALLATVLFIGGTASYLLSTSSPATMALYKLSWITTNGYSGEGSDTVFVYIHDSTAEAATYTTQSIVGRIISGTLEAYNLYLAPQFAGQSIKYSKLQQKIIQVQHTLRRGGSVIVEPLYIKASYNEKGVLSSADIVLSIRAGTTLGNVVATINSTVNLAAYSTISQLVLYMSLASIMTIILAVYIVFRKDREYVVAPEF